MKPGCSSGFKVDLNLGIFVPRNLLFAPAAATFSEPPRVILRLGIQGALFQLERFPQSGGESQHGFRFDRLGVMSRLFKLLQLLQCKSISGDPAHRAGFFCGRRRLIEVFSLLIDICGQQ